MTKKKSPEETIDDLLKGENLDDKHGAALATTKLRKMRFAESPLMKDLTPLDQLPWPKLMRDVYNYMEGTAKHTQPHIHRAATILFFANLIGRRYQCDDTRPNLYMIAVAESGGGKDNGMKCVNRLMEELQLEKDFLTADDCASDTALIMELLDGFPKLAVIDEFGDWLEGLFSKRATTFKRALASLVKKLFTNGYKRNWRPKAFAVKDGGRTKKEMTLHYPHFSMYGSATPKQLFRNLSMDTVEDGFVNRMLIVFSEEEKGKRKRIGLVSGVPEDLIMSLTDFCVEAGIKVCLDTETNTLSPAADYTLYKDQDLAKDNNFTISLEADRVFNECEDWALTKSRYLDSDGAGSFKALLQRVEELAVRIAITVQAAIDPSSAVISEEAAECGVGFAKYTTARFLEEGRLQIADTKQYAMCLRMRDWIMRKGRRMKVSEEFITEGPSELLSNVMRGCVGSSMDAKETKEVIELMKLHGMVRTWQRNTRGPGRKGTIVEILLDYEE